ncbi:hypothetical protein PAXRUDRAFT_72631, partial [Paxillus rubicundulus Ve08.2h10]
PFIPDKQFMFDVIREWQDCMHPDSQCHHPCAICAQEFKAVDIASVHPDGVDLHLLRNNLILRDVLPSTYNLDVYNSAILYLKALDNRNFHGKMDICLSCHSLLQSNKLPVDTIANFQYYTYDKLPEDVHIAFANSSLFDLMLVVHACATRVSY